MRGFGRTCLSVAVGIGAVGLGDCAMAQDAAAGQTDQAKNEGIADIVVTAQRRSETIQKTAISMTAFSSDSLREMNATALNDIGNLTPNALFNQNGGESVVFIRGIGQSDAVITADPGVAIYIDGVYIPRLFGDATDLLDTQRVEVLRGPQGTLFGKNTIGGAISVTTKTPSLTDFSATIEGRAGSRSRADIGGYVSGPLIEGKLGMSLAASLRSQDGYIDLVNAGKSGGDTNRQTARAKLYWEPSPILNFALAGEYYRQREVGLPTQLVAVNPDAPLGGLWNAFVGYPTNSPFAVSGLAPENTSYGTGSFYDDINVRGVSLVSNWSVGPGSLKSISAYRYIGRRAASDVDATPQPITRNPVDETSKTFSQELQYSGTGFDNRLHYVAGLFYLREHATDTQSVIGLDGLYQALVAAGLPDVAASTDVRADSSRDQITNSYAAFGELSYEFVDRVTLTVGARYSHERKLGHLFVYYPNQDVVGVDKSIDQSFSSFTPKIGLNFQATPTKLAYVSIAKGFKSGGFNGRPTVDAAVQPYKPETVWSYEAGIKTQWLDNRLRFNLAIFHMDYKDIQLQVRNTTDAGALLLTIANPGNARMNGFEGELVVRPWSFLTLSANIGYNDARYNDLAANAPVSENEKLIYNSKWNGALAARISVPLPDNAGQIDVQANYSFRSKYYLDAENTESIAQDAYGLLGGRISYKTAAESMEFFLYGSNLTNAHYKIFGSSQVGTFGWDAAAFAPPRELGVGARLSF